MRRSMAGLLAAVGTAMSALVGFAHRDFVWGMSVAAATADGLAVYLSLGIPKKTLRLCIRVVYARV
jgi:hypothetical protein